VSVELTQLSAKVTTALFLFFFVFLSAPAKGPRAQKKKKRQNTGNEMKKRINEGK